MKKRIILTVMVCIIGISGCDNTSSISEKVNISADSDVQTDNSVIDISPINMETVTVENDDKKISGTISLSETEDTIIADTKDYSGELPIVGFDEEYETTTVQTQNGKSDKAITSSNQATNEIESEIVIVSSQNISATPTSVTTTATNILNNNNNDEVITKQSIEETTTFANNSEEITNENVEDISPIATTTQTTTTTFNNSVYIVSPTSDTSSATPNMISVNTAADTSVTIQVTTTTDTTTTLVTNNGDVELPIVFD